MHGRLPYTGAEQLLRSGGGADLDTPYGLKPDGCSGNVQPNGLRSLLMNFDNQNR